MANGAESRLGHTLRQTAAMAIKKTEVSPCCVRFRNAYPYFFTAASKPLPALAKSSGTITG
jgi:hypothetical protein